MEKVSVTFQSELMFQDTSVLEKIVYIPLKHG